jgi:hypothetical protein
LWNNHLVEGCAHPPDHWVVHPFLNMLHRAPGIPFEPSAIEGLGHNPKLDDEVAQQILRFDLTALLAP